MTDRKLLQMALDAIEAALSDDQPYISRSKETVEALRSRLAQPEPEPYGYIVRRNWKTPTFIEADNVQDAGLPYNNPNYEPVFKAPPQREWQGLTTDELNLLWVDHHGDECLSDGRILSYERAIEAKLREKNG